MPTWKPALLLFLLSPVLGELLSGSAPPAEFFSPFGLTVLTVLYGGGAILVREMVIRWGKGWPSLLVLGMAYAIIEEGLMVKSFFDPEWVDIGILGWYGRWGGVNWVWSLHLTAYHAVISITIPITLAEMIFNRERDRSWVGRRGLITLAILFGLDVIFGFFFLTAYRPPVVPYLLAIVLVAGLVFLARKLPARLFSLRGGATAGPWRFWLLGFLGAGASFIVSWALPEANLPPPLTIFLDISLLAFIFWRVMRMSGNTTTWNDSHRLGLAAGALSLFILFAPVQEFDTSRSDNTTGMATVGLLALLFLLWLWRRVKKRAGPEPVSGAAD